MKRIERYMQAPEIAQEQVLMRLLAAAKNTEFGKQQALGQIRHAEDLMRRVPAQEYDTVRDAIARMMRGEQNVLCPGEVNWYSKSSGTTTDKSKYLPVPRENLSQNHLAGAWDALALLYHNRPDMEIFRRKSLLIPGSHQALAEYPKTRFGDISAVMTQNAPLIARPFCTPDLQTLVEPNFEKKLARMTEVVSKCKEVVMVSGVPTWVVVLFRAILEKTGKKNMLEVWPHLQAFMHGGMGFDPYRAIFKELIPDDNFAYQETYNASEGYFAAQCDLKTRDMLLLTDNAVFYEFMSVEEWGKEYPKTATIGDVEIGKTYALLISSGNGLWRYMPGDTLVFTRKYPHCIRITGRTRQFINTFGEEVMIGDTDKAIAQTCQQLGASVSEYTAGPVYFDTAESRGGHEWVVEFDRAPADVIQFSRLLDENLQRINSDYEAKRYKGMALNPLDLRQVPPGTFVQWMRASGKYGGQNKVPRLANHRQYVESVVKFADERSREL